METIKVLFLAANPLDTTMLRLGEEVREIEKKIRGAEYRGAVELHSKWAVRPDDLLEYLNRFRPHIVHFSGHGEPAEELILEDNAGQAKTVSKKALISLFKTLKDNIRVVVLNACFSQPQAEAIAGQIDCAIGMKKAIGDRAAITFAASFYRAIGYGRSIQEAFEQGTTALLLEGISESNTPELFVRHDVRPSEIILIGPQARRSNRKEPAKPSPIKVSLAKLRPTKPDLFGREKELATLDAAWDDPKTNIVSYVAFGGVGKTALVNKWLLQMREDNYRGAERVYGCSFFSQGAAEGKQASADEFTADALKWFGDPNPDEGSPWDKGERLADLANKHRTLLILDGLEPLQYPPGVAGNKGRLKDPTLQSLVRSLARHNLGLCVIATRLPVADTHEFIGTSTLHHDLDQLSPEAGAQLLETLGVNGTSDELKQAVGEYRGHALALTLLGRYIATAYRGEIRERDKIARLAKEPEEGGHARRVMAAYERWFDGKPEQNILRVMGMFDRPARGDAIEALKAEPAIDGLTSDLVSISDDDWQFALHNLRDARLLTEADPHDPDTLDAHPLVREHFGKQLRETYPDAWREGNDRLYEHLKQVPKEEFPDTIEEMAPLFAAVAHGTQAGRHQEALDEVFWRRIRRENVAFSFHNLGAYGADLAALSGFFDPPWRQPVAGLTESSKGFVLNEAGYALRALGRLEDAIEPMHAGVKSQIAEKDWTNAAASAINLSELYLTIGDVKQALAYAQQSVDLAEQSGDAPQRMINRTALADALHQAGRLDEAEAGFEQAEAMQKETDAERPILYSLRGFQYCDLLLDQGKYGQVQDRAGQTLVWVTEERWLLDIALDHLSIGRAHLLVAQQEGTGDFSKAADHLDQAVDGLRQSGHQEFIAGGLLARAALHRVRKDFDRARRDLDEATSIAERGGMGLHQADAQLEFARLHLAAGDKPEARESLATAKQMIESMGYHRRDGEVAELEDQLSE